jgi:GxxExxY protein
MHFEEEPRMNADEHGLRFEAETSAVISCAFEVLNTLGHGLLEKPYENSLCVEFGLRGIAWTQQPRYDVVYKTVKVGEYVPDLIVYGFVVADAKRIRREWKHVINDSNPKNSNHNRSAAEMAGQKASNHSVK